MGPVPSLDQVAEHPELVLPLPAPTLRLLMVNALKVQSACMMALIGQPAPAPAPESDRLLSPKEAAGLLGMSPLTLLRGRGRAPYRAFVVPTGTRSPRFSLHRIQQYIEQHAGERR